jgi:hypothetical protein
MNYTFVPVYGMKTRDWKLKPFSMPLPPMILSAQNGWLREKVCPCNFVVQGIQY